MHHWNDSDGPADTSCKKQIKSKIRSGDEQTNRSPSRVEEKTLNMKNEKLW